jgi:hypothetical protein
MPVRSRTKTCSGAFTGLAIFVTADRFPLSSGSPVCSGQRQGNATANQHDPGGSRQSDTATAGGFAEHFRGMEMIGKMSGFRLERRLLAGLEPFQAPLHTLEHAVPAYFIFHVFGTRKVLVKQPECTCIPLFWRNGFLIKNDRPNGQRPCFVHDLPLLPPLFHR